MATRSIQIVVLVDTGLVCEGETARRWMEIAQCFAGPVLEPPAPGVSG